LVDGFSFPDDKEIIKLHVDLEIKKVDAMDLHVLPLRSGPDFSVCETARRFAGN
jgi:hypothetical protein